MLTVAVFSAGFEGIKTWNLSVETLTRPAVPDFHELLFWSKCINLRIKRNLFRQQLIIEDGNDWLFSTVAGPAALYLVSCPTR